MTKSIDLSIYNEVFCDSLEALEWAYKNGLSKSSTIKTSSPAVLWDKKINTHNIESRWSIKELEKFQGGIQGLTKDIFDAILSINGVDREIALAISKSVYRFQRIIYKAACLDESDFTDRRLFIYVDGKTGPSGNMMNSPWDKFLSNNPFFKMERYTLCNDKWSFLTTQNVPGWRRFEVAGFETIVYRLAEKFMDKLPDWMFTKEILMPNENELNIEIAASLALRGVKIVKVKLKGSHSIENIDLHTNIALIYKEILPIIIRRIEQWVTPSAVEVTISLFKSYLENQLKQFELMSNEWGKVIVKNDKVKRISLPPFDPALLLINHIRDESHRFAIKNHRKKRAKKRTKSSLESIKGVGVNKRSALLNHFGGIQEIKNASIDELQKVVGINYKLATKIRESLKK